MKAWATTLSLSPPPATTRSIAFLVLRLERDTC
jgi:hypothetical protein